MTTPIVFPYATLTWEEPVVTAVFHEGAEMDAAVARELIKAARQLAGHKPYLLLSDVTEYVEITSDARKVIADKNESPLLVANAVFVTSLAMRLTANFFGNFNKPHFKLKVFNNREKAMKWLLQHDPRKKPQHLRQ